MSVGEPRRRLETWAQIAGYLGVSVATSQRWERTEGLPVHRHQHQALASVFADADELDSWINSRRRLSGTSREPNNGRPAAVMVHSKGRRWIVPASAVFFLIALGATWWLASTRRKISVEGTSSLLTSGPDSEMDVSLSPDGALAAYSLEQKGTASIYVKAIRGGEPKRLTRGDKRDRKPKWSPDGSRIAFSRESGETVEIYTVDAAGGREQRITFINHPLLDQSGDVNWVAWVPEGRGFIVADRESPSSPLALFAISLETSTRRQLTFPPKGIVGDSFAAAAPDGKQVAFVRRYPGFDDALFVVPAGGGEPQRITSGEGPIYGVAWTPDSSEVVFSSKRLSAMNTLWRVPASGDAPPIRIGGVIDESVWPSVARSPIGGAFRIAYQTFAQTTNLKLWPGGSCACPSSRVDWHAQFSPDGRSIAFSTNRNGSSNIWICKPDGGLRQVTSFTGAYTDSPRWSPDGRRLLFTSRSGDSREVFVADLDSGKITTLTNHPGDDGRASYSRDGKWIYFRSDRSGSNEIWKMPAEGGPARRITRTGAMEAFESPDGKLLYFTKPRPQLGVWSVPVEGGDARLVAGAVRETRWAVASDGIYFVTHERPFQVRRYRFNTRDTELVHTIRDAIWVSAGFSVSFDGTRMVWTETIRATRDLAVLDL